MHHSLRSLRGPDQSEARIRGQLAEDWLRELKACLTYAELAGRPCCYCTGLEVTLLEGLRKHHGDKEISSSDVLRDFNVSSMLRSAGNRSKGASRERSMPSSVENIRLSLTGQFVRRRERF